MITGTITFDLNGKLVKAIQHDGYRWRCDDINTEKRLNEEFGIETLSNGNPVAPNGYWNLNQAAIVMDGNADWLAKAEPELVEQ